MKNLKVLLIVFTCVILVSCNHVSNQTIHSNPGNENDNSIISTDNKETTEQSIIQSFNVDNLYEKDIKSLNCYNGTCVAILNDDTIALWGSNVYGGIGNGEIDENEKAEAVLPYAHCFNETIIDAGSKISSYALTESGILYAWGLNNTYETGLEGKPVLKPTQINNVLDIKQVSMSTSFMLALKEDGSVYHTGVKIEQFKDSNDYSWNHTEVEPNKTFVKLPLDFKCRKIDTSGLSYVFLSDDGVVYIQGIIFGNITATEPDLVFPVPTKIDFPEKIIDIAALTTNVVAVSETGSVYVFGNPYSGLSDIETDIYVSNLIYKKNIDNIASVDGTHYVVGALSKEGEIYAWGIDMYGIIKEENIGALYDRYEIVPNPTKLDFNNINKICIGISNGTAISEDGNIYIWGDNSIGQIIELK